ncbi:MAG: DUF5615 family PIN-like protein [Chloroflexi bacterium]|nr:DUF5615 family PIN-like protein [Chloroflexota bacterium]
MKVLFDECLPRRLKNEITGHEISTVVEMGWAGTKNGALIRLAETSFEVFVTVDQNLQYQQNLQPKNLAIIVLVAPNNQLATLRALMPKLLLQLQTIQPGQIVQVKY